MIVNQARTWLHMITQASCTTETGLLPKMTRRHWFLKSRGWVEKLKIKAVFTLDLDMLRLILIVTTLRGSFDFNQTKHVKMATESFSTLRSFINEMYWEQCLCHPVCFFNTLYMKQNVAYIYIFPILYTEKITLIINRHTYRQAKNS